MNATSKFLIKAKLVKMSNDRTNVIIPVFKDDVETELELNAALIPVIQRDMHSGIKDMKVGEVRACYAYPQATYSTPEEVKMFIGTVFGFNSQEGQIRVTVLRKNIIILSKEEHIIVYSIEDIDHPDNNRFIMVDYS